MTDITPQPTKIKIKLKIKLYYSWYNNINLCFLFRYDFSKKIFTKIT
jgi:hypothetical protein